MKTYLKSLFSRALDRFKEQLCPSCYNRLRMFMSRMYYILFVDQTTTTRLWFGLTSHMFGWFFFLSPTVHADLSEYKLMLLLGPDWLWAIGFWIHGLALMYGAYTNEYSKWQLFLEGVLGVIVWCGSAYAVVYTQGSLGAHAAGATIAFWVYIRYPTHWESKDVVG